MCVHFGYRWLGNSLRGHFWSTMAGIRGTRRCFCWPIWQRTGSGEKGQRFGGHKYPSFTKAQPSQHCAISWGLHTGAGFLYRKEKLICNSKCYHSGQAETGVHVHPIFSGRNKKSLNSALQTLLLRIVHPLILSSCSGPTIKWCNKKLGSFLWPNTDITY